MDTFMLGFTGVFLIVTMFGGLFALYKINQRLSAEG